MRSVAIVSFLAACASPPTSITGPTQRFVVDGVTLPTMPGQAATFGIDLNGDGIVDNSLGNLAATLAAEGDLATDIGDLISDGVLAESIVLTFGVEGAVGISVDDSAQLSSQPTDTGALATDGAVPVQVTLSIPALIDADPIPLELRESALQLVADGSGFDVQIDGLVDGAAFRTAAAAALVQMAVANPRAHLLLASEIDTNHDGVVSEAEAVNSPVVAALTAPDIGSDVSFGFQLHVDAMTVAAPIADHCHDRILDSDETGLDCGGSCVACAAGVACAVDADCDSRACDGGSCRAPSCSDGVLDGFELEIDCGGGCGNCAWGQRCVVDSDCAGGTCDSGGYAFGTCTS